MWENDLGRLTPVPQPLLLQDAKLRQELGASDIRRMLVVEGASADEVLTRTEALVPQLDALVKNGDIENLRSTSRVTCRASTCRSAGRPPCPIARRCRHRSSKR